MKIKVDPRRLGDVLRAHQRLAPTAFLRGARVSAEKVVSKAKRQSPVNDGAFRAAWGVEVRADMVRVKNDAPYAGIIERGARPHSVSAEGVEAIRQWVIKKGLVRVTQPLKKGVQGPERMRPVKRSEAEGEIGYLIDEVVWAIVNKIKHEGQKGTFILRKLAEQAGDDLRREVERQLQKLIEDEAVK